jgi:hypothetical protein
VALAILYKDSGDYLLLRYLLGAAAIIAMFASLENGRLLLGGGRGVALLLAIFLWPIGPIKSAYNIVRLRELEGELQVRGFREAEQQAQLQEA